MWSGSTHRRLIRTAGALLVCSALFGTPARAHDRGATLSEAWVHIGAASDLVRLEAAGLTIDEGRARDADGRLEQRVLASERAIEALRAAGFRVRVTRSDHTRGRPRGAYRDPESGDALLHALAAQSDRGGLAVLGTSVEGRPITALWLGQPPEAGAPTWRVLGAHHGDEWSSFEIALDTATALVEADGVDDEITALLDTSTVWIAPYVNPDGVVRGSRYNARDVDLNRNYDYEWSPLAFRAGDGPFSEPETRAVRAHAAFAPALASLSLHSGATNIGYVWNWSRAATPEERLLEALAQGYADACDAPGFYATNGADWYVTHGDTNDWSYGRYGGMDFTVEVSERKAPDTEDLPSVLAWHRDAVRDFLTTPITLAGRVVDEVSGLPVHATLTLAREDLGTVSLTTHAGAGTFARVAAPGRWQLEVEAPGYAPARRVVDVGAEDALALEVALAPSAVARDPSPRAVRGRTEVRVLDRPDGAARLVRPGQADVLLSVVDGVATIEGDQIPPGPWSVIGPDGVASVSGVFVEDIGPARLLSLDTTTDAWVVRGEGFAPGTRAWALVGAHRAWIPLAVLEEDAGVLVIDSSGLPPSPNVDLVVWSNGTQVAALDLVVAAPIEDDLASTLVRGACGWAVPPGSAAAALFLPPLLAFRRRRP